jgi:hypothetical protein
MTGGTDDLNHRSAERGAEEYMSEPVLVYSDAESEIWHGNALDLTDVELVMNGRVANLLCVDAPYSSKTHDGHKNGKLTADRAAAFAAANVDKPSPESRYSARKSAAGESGRRDINYDAWSEDTVSGFVSTWSPHCSGWMVSITDSVLPSAWSAAFAASSRYVFSPLPLVETGGRVRMLGDGPSSWTCWIVVARPRNKEFASWGTLPGAYVQPAERDINSHGGSDRVVGGKPLRSMMAIVRDYSRAGDLVVDPCVGGGTCAQAAKAQGRRFIGIDQDEHHCELAAKKLRDSRHQAAMPWAENQ